MGARTRAVDGPREGRRHEQVGVCGRGPLGRAEKDLSFSFFLYLFSFFVYVFLGVE